MTNTWLEYKYSFLGNMNSLIESLSEIEKSGLVSKVLSPAFSRLYENEKWKIAILPDRVDFYPRRNLDLPPNGNEFSEALSLFDRYLHNTGPNSRIAINSTIVFGLNETNADAVIYDFKGTALTKSSPNEFFLRTNNQSNIDGCVINNLVTISKGPLAFNGKPDIGVFVQFDINTAPNSIPESFLRENLPMITSRMLSIFGETKEQYDQSR